MSKSEQLTRKSPKSSISNAIMGSWIVSRPNGPEGVDQILKRLSQGTKAGLFTKGGAPLLVFSSEQENLFTLIRSSLEKRADKEFLFKFLEALSAQKSEFWLTVLKRECCGDADIVKYLANKAFEGYDFSKTTAQQRVLLHGFGITSRSELTQDEMEKYVTSALVDGQSRYAIFKATNSTNPFAPKHSLFDLIVTRNTQGEMGVFKAVISRVTENNREALHSALIREFNCENNPNSVVAAFVCELRGVVVSDIIELRNMIFGSDAEERMAFLNLDDASPAKEVVRGGDAHLKEVVTPRNVVKDQSSAMATRAIDLNDGDDACDDDDGHPRTKPSPNKLTVTAKPVDPLAASEVKSVDDRIADMMSEINNDADLVNALESFKCTAKVNGTVIALICSNNIEYLSWLLCCYEVSAQEFLNKCLLIASNTEATEFFSNPISLDYVLSNKISLNASVVSSLVAHICRASAAAVSGNGSDVLESALKFYHAYRAQHPGVISLNDGDEPEIIGSDDERFSVCAYALKACSYILGQMRSMQSTEERCTKYASYATSIAYIGLTVFPLSANDESMVLKCRSDLTKYASKYPVIRGACDGISALMPQLVGDDNVSECGSYSAGSFVSDVTMIGVDAGIV